MADDDFHSSRSRGTTAPRNPGANDPWQSDDPLAELARLIGQSDPMDGFARDGARSAAALEQPAGSFDWSAQDPPSHERSADDLSGDGRYADRGEPVEDDYDRRRDERYRPVRYADAVSSYRPGAGAPADEYETQTSSQISAPVPRFNGAQARDLAAPELPHHGDIQGRATSVSRQLPAFLPQAHDGRYEDDDHGEHGPDDQAYALEDDAEDAPTTRRRSGFVVVAAVLGLAVVGTAGAFAYRAMFGSSMLPSLPPIIKADSGPNKIVPTKPSANTADQADANNATAGEKVVSREEQPVDLPAPPVNPAPRVVSTIPIFPDPNSAQAGVPNAAHEGVLGSSAPDSAAPGAPPPAASAAAAPAPANPVPTAPAASIWPPAPNPAPVSGGAAATKPSVTPAAAAVSTEPRKIHTVIIRTDQMGAAAPDASSVPSALPSPPPAPVRTAAPRAAVPPAPRPMPAARAEENAPLSIVPDQGRSAAMPAPRVRTASARPPAVEPAAAGEPAAAAGGGYAVQVTSQRSEAAAQAEFRALRAKYPTQLGGHEPIVRRADLGAKGVYYRALVGPFASLEQASGLCSSLKAAGGSCIVQRN